MNLLAQVRETIDTYGLLSPGDTLVLGVSGGPDSLCLLHVLRRLIGDYGVRLHAAHLNHGIRGVAADDDARFVADLCRAWQVPFTITQVDVPALAQARGIAIEEAARQARYGFLADLARQLGARTVAVAHNADDQVETVLMHLLRGSGLAGLRGMRPLTWLDELRLGDVTFHPAAATERLCLVRPLLQVPRAAIETYCQANYLQPRFDLSNLDTTYYRNRLRHELLPLLEGYNPEIRAVLRRTAEVIAGDYDLLRAQLLEAWPKVVCAESDVAISYDLAALRAMPLGLQRAILREGIHRLRRSLRNINWVHVEDALKVLRAGPTGARATLPQGLGLTLGYAEAILASEGYVPPTTEEYPRITQALALPLAGTLDLPASSWRVHVERLARAALPEGWDHNPDPFTAYLDAARLGGPLSLRPRQEGDSFAPLGLGGKRQKLRDFLVNLKIPRAQRATVPLLVCESEIAWVVGYRLAERFAITTETREVLVIHLTRR